MVDCCIHDDHVGAMLQTRPPSSVDAEAPCECRVIASDKEMHMFLQFYFNNCSKIGLTMSIIVYLMFHLKFDSLPHYGSMLPQKAFMYLYKL